MISVIMLSGGFESTVTLKYLLEETTDDVMVHHIQMMNAEGRYEAEAEAVKKIVPYMRKIRRFRFSTSQIMIPELDSGYAGIDMMTIGFMGGHIVRGIHHQIGYSEPIRLVVGFIAFDDEGKTLKDTDVVGSTIFEQHFHDYYKMGLETPTLEFLLRDMTYKQEAYDKYIDPELDAMLHCCRRPKKFYDNTFIECGCCHTCFKMNTLRGVPNE